jgi:hypothetical protein
MNTPPPDASAASNGAVDPAGSISVVLDCNSDDDLAHTPPPQPLTPSPPPNKALNGGFMHEDHEEPPLSLLLRTIDFAAFVSFPPRRQIWLPRFRASTSVYTQHADHATI